MSGMRLWENPLGWHLWQKLSPLTKEIVRTSFLNFKLQVQDWTNRWRFRSPIFWVTAGPAFPPPPCQRGLYLSIGGWAEKVIFKNYNLQFNLFSSPTHLPSFWQHSYYIFPFFNLIVSHVYFIREFPIESVLSHRHHWWEALRRYTQLCSLSLENKGVFQQP